ncbi:MAG: hypothetical protein ACOCXM_05560 [Myxococcota bacterium]
MRIGDMLVAAGLTTESQIQQALARQKETGRRLGEELVDLGFVTEAQLTQVLSNQLSIPWVSLYHVEFSRELLNLIPAEVADRCGAIPVYIRKVRGEGDTLFVAMDDPTNPESLQRIRELTGMPVKAMVAAPSDIRSAIRVYYFGARPAARTASGPRRATRTSEPPAPAAAAEPPAPPPEDGAKAEQESSPVEPEAPAPAPPPEPPEERPAEPPATSKEADKKQPRMITLTLLDGTTVRLPAPQSKGEAAEAPEDETSGALTASDLIAALVGRAQGVEVSDVLPDDRWEPLFAALLSLLLRKGLIADWEFVEEWRKRQG